MKQVAMILLMGVISQSVLAVQNSKAIYTDNTLITNPTLGKKLIGIKSSKSEKNLPPQQNAGY